MHAHDDGGEAVGAAAVEQRVDGGVEGGMGERDPLLHLFGSEPPIARNFGPFGDGRDQPGGIEIAIAVDDEAGDGRVDERRIEQLGQPLRHAERAGIPGDVADPLARRQAQIAKRVWNAVRCVIAQQHERRAPVCIHNLDCFFRRIVHGAPVQ